MLQDVYNATVEAIQLGMASHEDPKKCSCGGGGWILTDFDTWEECPMHRGGQHPEDQYPEPWLRIYIEEADGSRYNGIVNYEEDGTKVYNDGYRYSMPEESDADLERAKNEARKWRAHVQRVFPERNLKVRLAREWD